VSGFNLSPALHAPLATPSGTGLRGARLYGQAAMGHFGTQWGQIGAGNNSNPWEMTELENRLTVLIVLIILILEG
jgi:hypothetical protein